MTHPVIMTTLDVKLECASQTTFAFKATNGASRLDFYQTHSAKKKVFGGQLYAKHQFKTYSDKFETLVYLAVEKSDRTEQIDAKWTMSVWSEKESKNLFEGTYTAIFGKPDWTLGPKFDINFTSEASMIVTFQIKKWNVTMLEPANKEAT